MPSRARGRSFAVRSLLTLAAALAAARPARAQELFVANGSTNTITVYRRADSGNIAPRRTLGGASTDVAPTDQFCKHAHYLAAQNVTLGCSTGKFCPADAVSRDGMAGFIAKGIVAPGGGAAVPQTYGPDPVTGLSYSCDPASPSLHFSDVPVSNSFCKHIHYLWARAIVSGCNATGYCPADPVSRDAIAKFIANGFNLQLYGP